MKKILIVDDDDAIVEAVYFVLTEEGYDVKGITRGDETLTTAESFEPDVILLDYLLSGKDGIEILQELKSKKNLKQIPVIMFSAHPNAGVVAREAGASMFIAKPFEVDELLDTISKVAN